ncbi:MAG: ATP-dependent DNA helicase RecG [Clostridia bacterium]|nr:ATP-dependent DNA helicase RecG [Clostridia bacterium]
MLTDSIKILKGIGEKRQKSLNDMGIYTIKDLLYHFPYKYKDISQKEFFENKVNGDEIAANVKVTGKPFYRRVNKSLNYLSFYLTDGKTKCKCTLFNQQYYLGKINPGDEFILIGIVKKEKNAFEVINPKIIYPDENTPDIITQYRLPNTIKQKSFEKLIVKALDSINGKLDETLPAAVLTNYNICDLNIAVRQIHFPESMVSLADAQYRMAFEEMYFFIMLLRRIRKNNQVKSPIPIKYSDQELTNFLNALPFKMTNAQRKATDEILIDIAGKNPSSPIMNRLLQGDVGCGKTVVAMAAIYITFINGYQSALMAPTEILAMQHYDECRKILEPLGVKTALLTSSLSAAEKSEIRERLLSGRIDLLVGTHAIIQSSVIFSNLALAVTDEQHRFGVNQRALLSQKNEYCHMLVMSATPVPRTLALIIYGDLDISTIDELPPGRKKVHTRIVSNEKRNDMYKYISENIKDGQQSYIVCPLIEESDKLDALSVSELYKELKNGHFAGISIGLLHGKMSDEEKNRMLNDFSSGKLRALISTTVIEVGVNVPGATIMVIENAERFGLAQLHQLRGRVGRNDKESWCFMTTGSNNAASTERLKIMTQTNDGFVISEKDLELRGPGQFLGMKQSGLLDTRVLALINNYELVARVKEAADKTENGELGKIQDIVFNLALSRYESQIKDIVLN